MAQTNSAAVAPPPVIYPNEPHAQTSFESGWHQQNVRTLAWELERAKAEIERLRAAALEAITKLENGDEAEDAVAVLAGGLWPESAS